jgi:hypothetical protein
MWNVVFNHLVESAKLFFDLQQQITWSNYALSKTDVTHLSANSIYSFDAAENPNHLLGS